MNRLTIVLISLFPLIATAQTGEIPKAALDDLSKDLAQLQKVVLDAQAKQQMLEAKTYKSSLFADKVTVTAPTYLRAGATEKSLTLVKASKGDTFSVIDRAGDWYAVELDKPIDGLKAGWLQTATAVPTAQQSSIQSGVADQIFRELTERAAQLKQSYQNNPYVNVTGFTVNMVPPSVSINFEFKK